MYLVSRVRTHYLLCKLIFRSFGSGEKLKRRFQRAMARRQRKVAVLTEYWRYLADTCLYLGPGNKTVKRIQG